MPRLVSLTYIASAIVDKHMGLFVFSGLNGLRVCIFGWVTTGKDLTIGSFIFFGHEGIFTVTVIVLKSFAE